MVNEQILAALKIGAQKSAAFWKPVYHNETDKAWRQIGLDIALDDTVSIAAHELNCEVWEEGRSLLVDDEKVNVTSEAYFALKDAWQLASKFKVGDKFKRDDGLSFAVIISAESKHNVELMVGNKDCIVEGDDEHIEDVLLSFRYSRV